MLLEVEWKSSWFKNRKEHSQGYWISKKNQRAFLEKAEKSLNIKHPDDWKLISWKQLNALGGFYNIILPYPKELLCTLIILLFFMQSLPIFQVFVFPSG